MLAGLLRVLVQQSPSHDKMLSHCLCSAADTAKLVFDLPVELTAGHVIVDSRIILPARPIRG